MGPEVLRVIKVCAMGDFMADDIVYQMGWECAGLPVNFQAPAAVALSPRGGHGANAKRNAGHIESPRRYVELVRNGFVTQSFVNPCPGLWWRLRWQRERPMRRHRPVDGCSQEEKMVINSYARLSYPRFVAGDELSDVGFRRLYGSFDQKECRFGLERDVASFFTHYYHFDMGVIRGHEECRSRLS